MGTKTQAQLALFSIDDEVQTYHDAGRTGFFSLLVDQGGDKRQSTHKLTDMPAVLGMIDKGRDTWMTQAEFMRPNRRVVNLLRIGLLFADIDTYRQPWAACRTPEQLAAAVLWHCAQEGLPTPSLLVYSGCGLQAKWLMDGTIPRQALPRWNACQRYLIDRLAALGADPQAKDASRVLRLVNTVNTKSGNICRVVHIEAGQDGQPVRYNFEYLAETLLPAARWTIEQQSQDRADQRDRQHSRPVLAAKLPASVWSDPQRPDVSRSCRARRRAGSGMELPQQGADDALQRDKSLRGRRKGHVRRQGIRSALHPPERHPHKPVCDHYG